MVVMSVVVSQALQRNREAFNKDLEALTDEEIKDRIRKAGSSSRITYCKAGAGMLVSFGLTYISTSYVGEDNKSLYPIIPVLTATFVGAPYSIYQFLKFINHGLYRNPPSVNP